MTTQFRPTTATAIRAFVADKCLICQKHGQCKILYYAIRPVAPYPPELIMQQDTPTCTAFIQF